MAKFQGTRKKSEYVRATTLFKSDEKYLPDGAEWKRYGSAEGKYLDAIKEVVDEAVKRGRLNFSYIKWDGDKNPVLSMAPAEPYDDGTRKKGGKSHDDDEKQTGKGKTRRRKSEGDD